MVDHELHRLQRIDPGGIALHLRHRVAHRGEIDDDRDPREILEQDARGAKRDLALQWFRRIPARQRFNIALRNGAPILETQQVLQEDLERIREAFEIETGFLERTEAEVAVRARPDF